MGGPDGALEFERSAGAITVYYSVQGRLSNANENVLAPDGMDSLFVGNFDRTGQMIGYLNQTENFLRFYHDGTWTGIGVSTGCRSAHSVSLYDPNYQDLVVLDPITESVLVYANSPDFLSQTAPTVVLRSLFRESAFHHRRRHGCIWNLGPDRRYGRRFRDILQLGNVPWVLYQQQYDGGSGRVRGRYRS